ncbi:MAG: MlaD family protein [Flavobacteriaceae bacterium]
MEKSSSEKIRLGIFVIIGTAFLVVAAYIIGNRQNMFGSQFTIHAVFRNVNGLQQGNNVRYSGINVGTVKRIQMLNDTTIVVSMTLQESIIRHVKTDAIATIGSDGLVGSMMVNIVPGNGLTSQVGRGDTIISYSRIGAEDMLSSLNKTGENAALLTADLLKVTEGLKEGRGTLGRLLNDTLMASDLEQTIKNLRIASTNANKTIRQVNELLDRENYKNSVAGVLMTDTISGMQFKNTLANLETSSENIVSMSLKLDSLITDIAEGDGALNYLATDTVLVQNLDATMRHLEEGTARFNENMEAMKSSFLTRGYFKKQEKEARKAAKEQSKQ